MMDLWNIINDDDDDDEKQLCIMQNYERLKQSIMKSATSTYTQFVHFLGPSSVSLV
jgi:hypothetical protein